MPVANHGQRITEVEGIYTTSARGNPDVAIAIVVAQRDGARAAIMPRTGMRTVRRGRVHATTRILGAILSLEEQSSFGTAQVSRGVWIHGASYSSRMVILRIDRAD